MRTLKDISFIKELHRSLLKDTDNYKKSKVILRKLIREKKACIQSGYIQHYPEYNSMISESLIKCKVLKKQLRVTADTLHKQLYRG